MRILVFGHVGVKFSVQLHFNLTSLYTQFRDVSEQFYNNIVGPELLVGLMLFGPFPSQNISIKQVQIQKSRD